MSVKRILVAEDDKSIQLLEKRILESAGYEVDCASDGDAALEMVKQNRYMMVVADVMMPGIDGFELTKEIVRRYHRSVPVLLVTAIDDPLKRAHEHDAKPFSTLRKPFTAAAFLTAVRLLESQVVQAENRATATRSAVKEEKTRSWLDKLLHPAASK